MSVFRGIIFHTQPNPDYYCTEIVEISSSDQMCQISSTECEDDVMEKFTDLKTDSLNITETNLARNGKDSPSQQNQKQIQN